MILMKTTHERYEAAQKAIKDAEARNMSRSTIERRYKALFAIEDAMKSAGWWL
jgi:uncharacterized protein involved in tolerance to divalent cations